MEENLKQIITAATSNNNFPIKTTTQEALDILNVQQGLLRDPADDLREKCFKVIQICLETKKSKFVSLAIQACHRILRDDRFHSNFEQSDDSRWLLGQLLQATGSFLSQTEDTQVDILKVFLNVACGNVWTMNGRLVIAVLSLCGDAFESGNTSVRTAAQAAASQTLRSFLSQLEEEAQPEDPYAAAYTEIIPIIQFICSRIDSSECAGRCEHGMLFLLECLLTVISTLPQKAQKNVHLRQVLWQKLAPSLISVLGTPRVDKHITSRTDTEEGKGRGSGCLAAPPTVASLHAKTVYSISMELVRVVGGVSSLRPMLESLFHRMLLYPPPAYRLDAVRATSELLRSPLRLLDIAAPMQGPDGLQSDLALIRLIMDSIEECKKGDLPLLSSAVSCCSAMIQALLDMSTGSCVPSYIADDVPDLWPNLLQCEYKGPNCYQSFSRLPSAYQDRIQAEQMSRERAGEESDSSGIGQRSDCSGDTEGPESLHHEIDSLLSEAECSERVPRSLGVEIVDLPISLGDSERQHARHFIGALHDLLTTLQPMWGNSQLDQALQTFASQYCQGVVKEQPITEWGIIVNADGIYLTTLHALLLDLRLYKAGYYAALDQEPILTEDEFVEEVQGSGVLVYLSGTWLREIYQAVVSASLLDSHGFFSSQANTHALTNLLVDIGGLGTRQKGSEMLWEIRRMAVSSHAASPVAEVAAGLRVARLVLTCCWSSLLFVLATPLALRTPRGKRRQQMLRDTVACCLQGLQGAAKLCTLLGTQDRCDLIVEQLSSASCASLSPRRLLVSRDRPPTLTSSAALSLELILQEGLELGSHCAACWPHMFRTVRAVRRLERAAFNCSSRDVTVSPPGMGHEQPQDDDDVDVYSFLRSSNGELMVTKYLKSVGYVDLLTPAQTANVLTLLSYMSVELIMDAAYKLNLTSLEHFTRALCAASRHQLFPPSRKTLAPRPPKWMQKWLSANDGIADPYLLDSVGELMVKSMRSSRPLAHMMRLWAVVGAHLTEAAGHSDPAVCKKAVDLIETCIDTHMKQCVELPYFHFNEALFKPFENLLCLELCDAHVQDQIVGSICEFVEGSAGDVRSGWRALFAALRSVPPSATFLDVFTLFLDTKNPLVFCSAAVDCIVCLLKHVRSGSDERRLACLQFLQRIEDVLSAIWLMPQPLLFQAAHRIHISDELLVDSDACSPELIPFENIPHDLLRLPSFSYPELAVSGVDTYLTLEALDRPSGVLRVWFLLLDGLYCAATSTAQPPLIHAVFADVLGLTHRDEPDLGVFMINHILLPSTQTWIRQCLRDGQADLSGPKQALGLLSDLVVSCIRDIHESRLRGELHLMLKQLMVLLIECAPNQATASTPPSCFRHIVLNIGDMMAERDWLVVVAALRRSFEVTLVPLRQVLMAFAAGSHSYYGDYDQIKVAARKDSTVRDVTHLKHLAQQVFLLEEQREDLGSNSGPNDDKPGERSYTFLLRPALDPSCTEVVRVPVPHLISSMISHQALLQVVAGILLSGSTHFIPSLVNVVLNDTVSSSGKSLPGHLDHMSKEVILVLLDCLDLSYEASLQFDSRPGLKFLLQKVVGLERAANLYRQAGAAWAVKVVVLFELCLNSIKINNLTSEDVKKLVVSNETSDVSVFLHRLQENFERLCDTYIDIVLDQDGTHSAVDKAPEQPILFLNACQDDQIAPIKPRRSESDVLLEKDEKNKLKPFMFSDFVDTVSASSTSDSELEFADEEDGENLDFVKMLKKVKESEDSDVLPETKISKINANKNNEMNFKKKLVKDEYNRNMELDRQLDDKLSHEIKESAETNYVDIKNLITDGKNEISFQDADYSVKGADSESSEKNNLEVVTAQSIECSSSRSVDILMNAGIVTDEKNHNIEDVVGTDNIKTEKTELNSSDYRILSETEVYCETSNSKEKTESVNVILDKRLTVNESLQSPESDAIILPQSANLCANNCDGRTALGARGRMEFTDTCMLEKSIILQLDEKMQSLEFDESAEAGIEEDEKEMTHEAFKTVQNGNLFVIDHIDVEDDSAVISVNSVNPAKQAEIKNQGRNSVENVDKEPDENNEDSLSHVNDIKSVKSEELNGDKMATALEEYKKRKDQHRQELRKNPFLPPTEPIVQATVPPEIEVQRRNSFLKDSEAHRRVWAEMLDGVFQLLTQLSDEELRLLLPLLFAGVRRLTAHAADPALKQSVSQLLCRIADVYGFASP